MIVGASVQGGQSIVGRIRRRRVLEGSEWDEAGYREEETLDGIGRGIESAPGRAGAAL